MISNEAKGFSVVVPIFNEIDNIESLFLEIKEVFDANAYSYEVLFVDDGSSDGSDKHLEKLSNTFSTLRYIKHIKNYGQSSALISGIKSAAFPTIITLDGDGQNDPRDIPRLIDIFHQNPNAVVLGNRKKRDDNWVRVASSRISNAVRQFLLKDNCPDTGCSLKLFSRQAFLSLPHFNHIHRFLPALFKRSDYKIINVLVNHRPRMHGTSKYGVVNRLFVGIIDIFGVMWLSRRPCRAELEHEPN